MNDSKQELLKKLESWFSKNSDVLRIAKRHEKVFRKHEEYRKNIMKNNVRETTSFLAMNMSELASVKFSNLSETELFISGENRIYFVIN